MNNLEERKKQVIANRKAEVDNYINSLKAILSLRLEIIKNTGDFFFGGNLHYVDMETSAQTPDIVARVNTEYIIGEVKKSLRNPDNLPNDEEYLQYVKKDIFGQLQKYDHEFVELEGKKHDLILLVPYRDIKAVGIIKLKYLEPLEISGSKLFRNNFGLLTYSIEHGANTQFIIIKLETGFLSDKKIFEELRIGSKNTLSDIKKDLGRYKIYQESDKTPIEYVMVLLWTTIFPEIVHKNSIEKMIEWRDEEAHEFEVTHETIMSYLHKLYTMPAFTCEKKQFNSKIISKSMEHFSRIYEKNPKTKTLEPTVEIIRDGQTISYRIKYRRLPAKDELDYFLNALYRQTKSKEIIERKKSYKQEKLDL